MQKGKPESSSLLLVGYHKNVFEKNKTQNTNRKKALNRFVFFLIGNVNNNIRSTNTLG